MVRRLLQEKGGALKLCEVSLHVRGVFDALQLTQYFEFYPDQAAAVASFDESAAPSND
jgi:anti-anti-sigma regulatory factor